MTLIRCCLIALCIMFAAGSYAQERATPPPDGPQPSLDKRKARLALLSQISSKSPSGSSFMAKLEDPVKVEGQPVLPKGTLVEGHLETIPARRMMRRGALRMICADKNRSRVNTRFAELELFGGEAIVSGNAERVIFSVTKGAWSRCTRADPEGR